MCEIAHMLKKPAWHWRRRPHRKLPVVPKIVKSVG